MLTMSCTLNPTPDLVRQARRAEALGYQRVWINDSPNVYPDVWMVLAELAAATDRIGLGPAVLVPGLRHVVVNAAALATLERRAPGRVAAAIGTGNTGRRLLGLRPHPWAETAEYTRQLRELLAGHLVMIDGRATRLEHLRGIVAERPVPIQILLAAMGPTGLGHAHAVADGVFRVNRPVEGFDVCVVTVTGTVLDPAEDFDSPRVLRDAGPAVALAYHQAHDAVDGATQLAGMPHGSAWLDAVQTVPESERHLVVHRGHFLTVDGPDAQLVDPETVRRFTFSDHDDGLRSRLRALAAGGATEIAFHPTGKDTGRELEAFARVLSDLPEPASGGVGHGAAALGGLDR